MSKAVSDSSVELSSYIYSPSTEGGRGGRSIGTIPEGWTVERLGDVVSIHDNQRIPLSEPERQRRRGRHPYCGANGVLDYIDNYLFDGEYVLLAEDGGYWGPLEQSAYLMRGQFWVNNHAHVLKGKPLVLDNEFLVNALNFLDLSPFISGTTRGKLNQGVMSEIPFPLPPFAEQRAIARVLNTMQKAKEARKRELALERERKAALMEWLFTHGTRGEEIRKTDIGYLPRSWDVAAFDSSVEISSGQVDPRVEPYSTMLHVGPDNIEADTGRLLPAKTARELTLISGKYLFTPQDVLYSKIRPYLRKVALPTFTGICSADMYPLRPRDGRIKRDYLFHYLLTQTFTNKAIGFQNRTGIPKINREQLGQIPVPIPDADEQTLISSILNACNSKSFTLENEVSLLQELFESSLDELMKGRLPIVRLPQGDSQ